MKLLIKNGVIVASKAMFKADIAVKNGKIAAIGEKLSGEFDETADASGKLVLPGAIDSHTHLALPVGATVSSDDYFTGTRSAACGGTTTVFDFIQQDMGELLPDAFYRRNALAAPDAAVDYSFHIGLSDISKPEYLESMQEAVRLGITSYKAYMVYDFGLNDGELYELLCAARKLSALVGVHAENRGVLAARVKQYLREGKTGAWWHYMSRDEMVEGEADERAINIAQMAQAPLYLVHLADAKGVEALSRARDAGYPIFAETCPQYLNFTNEVYKRERGRDFVCSPPIKGQKSQDAVWAALKRGDIFTVATDHCPFKRSEKDWGVKLPNGEPGNFTTIPNGCAGIENMYPYMLSEANKGTISFPKAVEVCASNPAKLFGIQKRKGELVVGRDADIVIYDPQKLVTVKNENMHGNTDYTIWEGVKLKGYPVMTYSRGRLVYKDGEFVGKRGAGEFIKCDKLHFNGSAL